MSKTSLTHAASAPSVSHTHSPCHFLSFTSIAGIVCLFAALSYAEFASMVSSAGSAYTYAHATMGQGMGWIIGWDLILGTLTHLIPYARLSRITHLIPICMTQ